MLNYAGQVAVEGEPFQGKGLFKFALIKGDNNTTIWSNDGSSVNGSEPLKSVSTSVDGGLYSILLGNSSIKGMSSLNPSIFQKHSNIKLRVWFSDGINGFEQLSPDRSFASVPYAFSAGSAPIPQGSINRKMLSADVRSDLNSSLKKITRDMLPKSVLDDLNSSIKKIKREMLPDNVLAQLDRKLTRSDLPVDVLTDLNRTIQLNSLSPEVLSALQVTPSISTQPFARYDWRTDSATIEARGRGHNLSYQWLKNGETIAGANAPVLELSNPVLDDNATYSVQLTNSVGQTTSQNITLQQAIGAPGFPIAEANATQVPRNGLVLWLDANDLNADGLADNLPTGTLIDSWKSKVGDANATQTSEVLKPKSKFFGDTNLKAVAFDGGDYLLDDNASLLVQHIFAIYRGLYERHDVLISDNIVELVKIDHSSKGSYFYGGKFHNSTGGTVRMSGNSSVGHSVFYSNWQNDLVSMTAGSAGNYNGTFAKLGIGAKTANSSNWEGEFGEILFYNRALSNTERDAVERYLADKWNIQLHADKLAAEQAAYNAALPIPEPETGLLAYYKFEPLAIEPDKVWDHSGNGNHLNMSGFDGDPWVEGVDGKALKFDGVDSKAGGVSNQDLVTVCFWVKPQNLIDSLNQSSSIFFNTHGDSSGTVGSFSFNAQLDGQPSHLAVWQRKKKNAPNWKITRTNFSQNYTIFNNWLFILLNFNSLTQVHEIFLNNEKLPTTGSSPLERNTNEGSFSIGYYNLSHGYESESFSGLLDEFRIYNRSLTPAEIEGLYLQVDSPILRMAPEHNATVGANFSLSLAADNGPTTYLAEGLPTGLSLNVSTGQITGTVSKPGYHRVFVKAMNEHGTGSDTIAIIARPQTDQYGWPVDIPDGSDIPQNGLVLWLDANDIDADEEFDTGTDHLKLANWTDKAGMDHNATQATAANQPEIRSGQISGKPNLNVLVFDGNQSLSFPAINQGRTFFWVLNRHAQGRSGANFIGNDTPDIWGNNQQSYYNTFQFTTTNNDVGTQIKNGVWSKNGLTGSSRDFFNFDQLPFVLSLVTEGMAPSKLIGKRGGSGQHFIGNIGEILIYDQALQINQIETVEKYLGQKWGISISHDTTPSPSGIPPTYRVTPANDSVTTAHLTEQILKYLKPEITTQPEGTMVPANGAATLTASAEGKFLTYQWQKDGTDLIGETNATLVFSDFNGTQDDGNYTITISNDFGSVISAPAEIKEQ
ncbi:MAG: putative Ig domain-containing protein [Opitutales bacterium]|nr:putative Ig domain-containing protein [Opitutales bacterium]